MNLPISDFPSKLASIIVMAAVMLACSAEQPTDESAVETQVSIERIEAPSPAGTEKYMATLTIDGMGCAMACGNKISGALAGLDGVKSAEIDFVGAGEENSAIVEFDAAKVTEQQMIEAVNGMKGGHYAVKSVKLTHYTGKQVEDETETKNADQDKVSYRPGLLYDLPNFFGVFSRLF